MKVGNEEKHEAQTVKAAGSHGTDLAEVARDFAVVCIVNLERKVTFNPALLKAICGDGRYGAGMCGEEALFALTKRWPILKRRNHHQT